MAVMATVLSAGLGFAQGKIIIEGELDVPGPFNPDFEVTIDADGTIDVDNTGPNQSAPFDLPDWLIPDTMTPVTIDVGLVDEDEIPAKVGGAVARGILTGWFEVLVNEVERMIDSFLAWFESVVSEFRDLFSKFFSEAEQATDADATAVEVADQGLYSVFPTDTFVAGMVAGVAAAFESYLASQP